MKLYGFSEIQSAINLDADLDQLLEGQRQAFIDSAKNLYESPLPLLLSFPARVGDCHVKACYRQNGKFFVIKMASGFYRNHEKGLPGGDGCLLVCSKETGMIEAILHDAGFLTTMRTALAGALLARITPWEVKSIGILGTGALAKETIALFKRLYPHGQFLVWGRDAKKAHALNGERVQIGNTAASVIENADIVVTTTATTEPIITALPGGKRLHIIALGSDDEHKNECASHLFLQADLVIVDSVKQARLMGEVFHAINRGYFSLTKAQELGTVLEQKNPLSAQIIISDLSGIAAQDYEIAGYVLNKLG